MIDRRIARQDPTDRDGCNLLSLFLMSFVVGGEFTHQKEKNMNSRRTFAEPIAGLPKVDIKQRGRVLKAAVLQENASWAYISCFWSEVGGERCMRKATLGAEWFTAAKRQGSCRLATGGWWSWWSRVY